MDKKNILINIATETATKNFNHEYISVFNDLFNTYKIKTFQIFYGNKLIDDSNYIENLKNKGIEIRNYIDLDIFIKDLNDKYNILYINTFTEDLIESVIKSNEILGKENPKYKDIFRNKNIQRKLLQDYNPEIGIKYLEFTIDDINIDKIEDYIGYPFILKPSSGLQSAGVSKINNKENYINYINNYKTFLSNFRERGFDNEVILAEEFLDGEMYSIDYYVDLNQNIFISKPVKVELASKLGIDDFFNYSRIISKNVEKELEKYNLEKFVNETVKASDIKNFFIHHEFKLTSKGKLKTIEINGRIGGYRAGIYLRGYGLNLFNFILGERKEYSLLKNNSVLHIHPESKGILKGFNEELWKEIGNLDSVFITKKIEKFIGKEIGLTKDGFGKVGIIKLQNKDLNIFEKDMAFIQKNYRNLLIMQ